MAMSAAGGGMHNADRHGALSRSQSQRSSATLHHPPPSTMAGSPVQTTQPAVKPLEFQTAMRDFATMFPTLDRDTIETVLRANSGAVDATIDNLLEMCDSLDLSDPPPKPEKGAPNDRSATLPAPAATGLCDKHSSHRAHNLFDESSVNAKTTVKTPIKQSSNYRYQAAMFKFNNPLVGPLPEGFLRVSNDPKFDQDERYARRKDLQVRDITNSTLSTTYSNQGFEEFASVPPLPPATLQLYEQEYQLSRSNQHQPASSPTSPSPGSGAIPKNYVNGSGGSNTRSWSGQAKTTLSSFGKKFKRPGGGGAGSGSSGPGIGASGSTVSTMNLLSDFDQQQSDEEDLSSQMLREEEDDDDEYPAPAAAAAHEAPPQRAPHSYNPFDDFPPSSYRAPPPPPDGPRPTNPSIN